MIVYDLDCEAGHRFEGWFGSSDDYSRQQEAGLVACPSCGSAKVTKAPMAPAVPRKGSDGAPPPLPTPAEGDVGEVPAKADAAQGQPAPARAMPPALAKALARAAAAQAKMLSKSRFVGRDFAETSRAIHYGERPQETIHGQASAEEARDLAEEGITIAVLPFALAPPDEVH